MLINSHVNKKLIRVCCLIKTLFDDKNKPLNISREYHELHVFKYFYRKIINYTLVLSKQLSLGGVY